VANSVSQEQLDQDRASMEEADARVKAFEKNMEVFKLNHEFTEVTSPIDGQISRYYLTLGNLVNQDQTLLTTVVSLDPMYAYFDVDEATLLRIRKAVNEGRIKRRQDGADIPVLMGLQGEEGFPHQGTVNFVDNQVDPTTGSITVRGVFSNPEPPGGIRLLSPGMFVRIRLPIGPPHPALLVVDRAVASDQGLKYVYVVDAQNKVQYRRVTTGPLQDDGLRVIAQGLKRDEWVIVGALQQVRPRMQVEPERTPMPSLGQPTGGEPPSAEPRAPTSQPAGQVER
jgi:multidrug efflux system membrane fusion protein